MGLDMDIYDKALEAMPRVGFYQLHSRTGGNAQQPLPPTSEHTPKVINGPKSSSSSQSQKQYRRSVSDQRCYLSQSRYSSCFSHFNSDPKVRAISSSFIFFDSIIASKSSYSFWIRHNVHSCQSGIDTDREYALCRLRSL